MTGGDGGSRKPGEGGFAGRWSRMKRAARTGEPVAAAEPAGEAAEDTGAAVEDARSDAEVLAELGLPDPDALAPGDDFRVFMAKAVPARIRNRALRRLWLSNPVLSGLDELVDYGEDYTDAAVVVENLQTAYQVGRGWAAQTGETAGGGPEAEVAAADETGAVPAGDRGEQLPEDPGGDPGTDAPAPESAPAPDAPPDDEARPDPGAGAQPRPASRRRRRMRFRMTED